MGNYFLDIQYIVFFIGKFNTDLEIWDVWWLFFWVLFINDFSQYMFNQVFSFDLHLKPTLYSTVYPGSSDPFYIVSYY